MDIKWTDKMSALCALGALLVSILTPLVVYIVGGDIEDEIKQSTIDRTVLIANDSINKIDAAVKLKMKYENTPDFSGNPFDFSHIEGNYQIQGAVFEILNEYEKICLLLNHEYIDKEFFEALRGKAIQNTFSQYGPYIEKYRATYGISDAWASCRKYIAGN